MSKEHVYSDLDMILASQIAYMDAGGSSRPNVTVGDMIDNARSKYGVYDESSGTWKPREGLTQKQIDQLNAANTLSQLMEDHGASYAKNWKVIDRCDKNDTSGFYGCVIDTGDGNAIVGFRGSESYDAGQYIDDWGKADLGLLNNALTEQQKDAEEYIRHVYDKYGDDYNTFSLTGHSLGGNLAQHAGNMAPDEMRGKIYHVISFDGPGFSDEYIKSHYIEIQKAKRYQSHYQWSLVGSLLTPLPGTEDRVIKAHDDPDAEGSVLGIDQGQIMRHVLKNVDLTDDGSVQDGEMSELAKILGPLSRGADAVDAFIFLLVPVLGQYIAPLAMDYYAIKFIVTVYDNTKTFIRDEFNKWKKKVNKFFKDLLSPNVSGTYSATARGMLSYASELDSIDKGLRGIASEVHSIEQTLLYDSLSGSYAKSKLKLIRLGIVSDARKADKCANVITTCAQNYSQSDRKAADIFSGI